MTLTVAGMTLEELQDKVIRFERGDDPVPYAVGLITKLEPDGKGYVHFTAEGPAVLLLSRDLPFELPMNEQIRNRAGFAFWWKQLDYVFNLTDPRTFPPLEAAVSTDERRAIERYIQTAADLAETEVLNALDQGFSARKNDETGEEIVAAAFGRKDAQLGLSGLLRHCDSRAHKDGHVSGVSTKSFSPAPSRRRTCRRRLSNSGSSRHGGPRSNSCTRAHLTSAYAIGWSPRRAGKCSTTASITGRTF